MNAIKATIADYQAKLREQEKAVAKTKSFINMLCGGCHLAHHRRVRE